MAPRQFETIEVVEPFPGVREIAFNRPQRFNSFTPQVYDDWLAALQDAASDDSVRVVVITGRGKFYSSGQELALPSGKAAEDPAAYLAERAKVTKSIGDTLITFPKLLIAAVNGPSIGYSCTSLGLMDIVYAVPEATFRTPFMDLALAVEGCSSILFPRIMGPSKANEMLFLGVEYSAQEWERMGMIARIIPADRLRDEVLAIAKKAAGYSPTAMAKSKNLVVGALRDRLLETNAKEMELVEERMNSQEFVQAVMKFMAATAAKKKAKKANL
ncbi:Enoyl-CoA delta isomerase 2, mitochondrial [Blyttiomyces sp. JEL0837]|nr:Enoyl-CoA delta isomerase 2, mitochondrial [Blyttiomyces sp. JEL0837]